MTKGNGVAVTGSSGCFGRALLKRLLPEGGVRALFLPGTGYGSLMADERCHVVLGGLDDEQALEELVAGAETVFHCAAEMGKGDPGLSHKVNVVGTENLAQAARKAGVSRFVYVSSISVFGATSRTGNTVTEAFEPENPHSLNAYSSTKYYGELAVRNLANAGDFTFTIIRPTNVYGPHSRPWFLQFERLLNRIPIAIGDFPIDLVYVDDVVEAMIRAAASPACEDQDFNIGNEMVNLSRFMVKVGGVTGRKIRKLPGPLDLHLRKGISRAFKIAKGKPMSMSLLEPTLYPHTKARETFGYSPSIMLDEGFEKLAEWHRSGRP